MKKRSASDDLTAFPSPGVPQYRGKASPAIHKGSASERIPASGAAATAMTSFYSGARPSKWENAERWICSPLSSNKSLNPQSSPMRPKAKSGPARDRSSDPAPADRGSYRDEFRAAGSPFSTGVLAPVGGYGGVPGWPEVDETPFYPSPKISLSSQSNEPESDSHAASQRHVMTQMSTGNSLSPAPLPGSSPAALLSGTKQRSGQTANSEVRDVEVDKRATVIKWSKKGGIKSSKKSQHSVVDFGQRSYEISEAAMDSSKWRREEAKIAAWENLQKAKAEAAIRKLEMKLEKKRSATMDKIVEQLRNAEFKARKMRSKLPDDNNSNGDRCRIPRSPEKRVVIRSLSRLFTWRAS